MIWALFIVGQLIHLAVQVDAIVRAKNNPATRHLQVLADRWIVFTARSFVCTMVFWIFLGGGLPEILGAFDLEAPQWVTVLGMVIHTVPPLAGVIGYAIDSGLSFLPVLKSSVPPAPEPPSAT